MSAIFSGMAKTPPRPRDMNQLAKRIVDLSVGETTDEPAEPEAEKNPHAVALGRLGGLRGGKVRAERLAPAKRSEIARAAARSRWKKKPLK
jgi:hypothetical protein